MRGRGRPDSGEGSSRVIKVARKKEGKSSLVNTKVMTGVATVKDPRWSIHPSIEEGKRADSYNAGWCQS